MARLPWCAADLVSPEPRSEMARHPLGHPPRVDEDRAWCDAPRSARRAGRRPAPRPRPTSPLRAGRPGTSSARSRARRWPVSTMVQSAPAPPPPRRPGSARPPRSASAWPRGRRAAGRRAAERAPSRSSESARWAPRLLRRQRVDLVDDHGARGREHRAAGLRAEQDVERLRRGHDDVRRAAAHAVALARPAACRRCAPRCGSRRPAGPAPQRRADAGERRFQVALDVVRERLERRDVDDLGLVRQPAVEPLAHQRVDRGEEGGERLAGAGRGRDQRVPAGLDRRPRPPAQRRTAL